MLILRFHKTCLFFLILFPHIIAAQNVKPGKKPSWVTAQQADYNSGLNSKDVTDGSYYLLADFQYDLNSHSEYRHYVKKIVNSEGVQNSSEIRINFNPEFQQLILHEIKIIRNGKSTDALDLKKMKLVNVEDNLDRFIYNGTKTAYFILEDMRKGDIVEYSFSTVGNNPVFGNHFDGFFDFQFNEPLEHLYYSITVPNNQHLNFKYFNDAQPPVVVKSADKSQYYWSVKKIAAKIYDEDIPSWYSCDKQVQFSDFQSWQELRKWAYGLFQVSGNSKDIDKLVSEINAKNSSPEQKAAEAIRFVQDEIRYMGVEIGEHSQRPHVPGETLQKRFGDCKDKALLLCTVLNKLGFRASPVLISTDYKEHIKDYLPGSRLFDHAVVVATVNNKNYWIDATISNQGGSLNQLYFPDYHSGLVADNSTGDQLAIIPVHEVGEQILNEYFSIKNTSDKISLTVYTHYSNYEADKMRSYLAGSSRNEIQKEFVDYYADDYPEISASDSMEVFDDRLTDTILTIERYDIKNQWTLEDSVSNHLKCLFYARGISERLVKPATKIRSTPIAMSYPMNYEQNIFINLFDDWSVDEKNTSIVNDAIKFDYQSTFINRRLKLTYKLESLKNYVDPLKVSSYLKDIDNIKNYLGYQISYTSNTGAATEKKAGINWLMVFFAIMVLMILSFIAMQVYKVNNFIPYADAEEPEIGGALILLAIVIWIKPILILYQIFVTADYFNHAIWLQLTNPQNASYNEWWGPGLMFELFANLFSGVLAVLCIVLFIKKRNIFPGCAIAFFAINLILALVDFLIMGLLKIETESSQIGTIFIQTLIWIPYLLISERVRMTFIMPSDRQLKEDNVFVYAESEESTGNTSADGEL